MSYECHFTFTVIGKKKDVERFVEKLPEIGLNIDGWHYKYSDEFNQKGLEDVVEFYFHESGNHLDNCFEFDITNPDSYSKMAALVPQLELNGDFGDEYESGFVFSSPIGNDKCITEYTYDQGQIQMFVLLNTNDLSQVEDVVMKCLYESKNSIISNVYIQSTGECEGNYVFLASTYENRLDEWEHTQEDIDYFADDFKKFFVNLCVEIPSTVIKCHAQLVPTGNSVFEGPILSMFNDLDTSEKYFISDGFLDLDYEVPDVIEEFNDYISNNHKRWEQIILENYQDESDYGDEDNNEGIFFDIDVEVKFNGTIFVLSGDFECGTKGDVSEQISRLGGVVSGSVSGKTNYLVIGHKESANWTNGAAGGKKWN
jgi:hypothetical protein